jgi:hypothetical protein
MAVSTIEPLLTTRRNDGRKMEGGVGLLTGEGSATRCADGATRATPEAGAPATTNTGGHSQDAFRTAAFVPRPWLYASDRPSTALNLVGALLEDLGLLALGSSRRLL